MIKKHVEIIKEYKIKPHTVLEIGSRDGDDSFFYKNEFSLSDENIHIVEPNPLMFQEIQKKYPNFKLYNVAIDDSEGVKEFNQVVCGGSDPIGVSSLLERADDFYKIYKTNKINVTVIRGENLMKQICRDIDICKVDVEGLTYEVLMSFGDSISKIKTFHLETEHHSFWKNQKLHSDVVSLMQKLNFELIWWDKENHLQSDSIWVNKIYL
jgi:FkbM family methyltransferase